MATLLLFSFMLLFRIVQKSGYLGRLTMLFTSDPLLFLAAVIRSAGYDNRPGDQRFFISDTYPLEPASPDTFNHTPPHSQNSFAKRSAAYCGVIVRRAGAA